MMASAIFSVLRPAAFWLKVGRLAGRLPMIEDVVAAWYCLRDPATPLRAKLVLGAAVAYFVLPVDLVPDFIPGIGYADDAAVVMAAVRALRPHITDRHRAQAREALASQIQM